MSLKRRDVRCIPHERGWQAVRIRSSANLLKFYGMFTIGEGFMRVSKHRDL